VKTKTLIISSLLLPSTSLAQPVINEVESSGGSPNDWIELYGSDTQSVDLSGWILRDSRDYNSYIIPHGTTIHAHEFLVFDRADLGFSLGRNDSVRLFDSSDTLVDAYTYRGHADTTYGRCPDGVGAFVATSNASKGTANICEGDGGSVPVTLQDWPGSDVVEAVDPAYTFSSNLSGLHFEPENGGSPDVLWSV